ncbi:MAG: hypothetical protein IJR82_01825 [Bacilli bacterium]|nr:hypothetical protein [Bacilli bacterium]
MSKKLLDQDLEKKQEEITKEIIDNVKKEINNVTKNIKDDIVKEIRFEANTVVKDDIKEQLITDINSEIKDNVRKEQRFIIRSKNFKLFRKNILILLLIGVIGYFGYCLWDAKYFKFMKNYEIVSVGKNNDNTETKVDAEVIVEEQVIKDKQWYINNYGYLLNNIKLSLPMDNSNVYYLYSGNMDKNNMKDTIKLNLAYKFIENKTETDNNYSITEEEMQKAYLKLFGELDSYQANSFTVDCMQFYYNATDKIFTAFKFTCDTVSSLQIKEEIKDMYEDNDYIVIETVMGVYNVDNKQLFNYINLYNAVTLDFDETKSVLDYENSLNTYKYKFKRINDNYYFESIEKVK